MQFWSEPRRSCRLSSQEKCLRQGRDRRQKTLSLNHRFAPVDTRCGEEIARGCPSSCYGIGVEHPLQPLGSAD